MEMHENYNLTKIFISKEFYRFTSLIFLKYKYIQIFPLSVSNLKLVRNTRRSQCFIMNHKRTKIKIPIFVS